MADDKVIELLDKFKKFNTAPKENFNILMALHIEYREVYLCRLIGSILSENPKASELFGKLVLQAETDDFSDAEVVLEELIEKDRRVDLVIKTSRQIYPIEAKVFADDRSSQLCDCWNYYHEKHKNRFSDKSLIYYLTPNGREPSFKSIGTLKKNKVKCISFEEHIRNWLNCCLSADECEKYCYALEQLSEVINSMTENQKVIEKIWENNNKYEYVGAMRALFSAEASIAEKLREEYIRETFNNSDIAGYELVQPHEETKKTGEKVIFEIQKGSAVVAKICVDKNLYLRTSNGFEPNGKLNEFKHWNKEKWEYLFENNNSKEINLKSPWESLSKNSGNDRFSNLQALLDSIELV